jgi:RNA polymerase sigma-70 factor (ECF subfamily)
MNKPTADTAMDTLNRLIAELRPKLHRYCARMTGSVIDGEDVVQDAIVKALEAQANGGSKTHPEGWLFRIAHNASLDFLRRRARQDSRSSEEDLDMMVDPLATADQRLIAVASLRTFMRLPVAQRSSVILMDVLGYSLKEIGDVTHANIPVVKAALHRGRARLLEFAQAPDDDAVPIMGATERSRLALYVDRFNARDFDAVRDMLVEEVQLELVSVTRRRGRNEVGQYFHNYDRLQDWTLVPGWVDRRPGVLVTHSGDPSGQPLYFIFLDWEAGSITSIRDFAHARYVVDGAEFLPLR